jgi:pimeloyl-ACP methyl ester carboxylesterase
MRDTLGVPRFSVPGAELDWWVSDEGGEPVVQLHGLTSSSHRDRLLNLDLGRGLSGTRLLRYDARGHGQSTGSMNPTDYRWDRLADDLLRLLDHVFPNEPVHGVGPSMGCGTLLHAITRAPERFSALTLMVPPTAWGTRVAKAADYRLTADLVEAQGMSALLATENEAVQPPAMAEAPPTNPDVSEALLPTIFRGASEADLPAREAIAGIKVPTLVLAWIADPGHPLSTAERITDLICDSQLVVARTPADLAQWPHLLHEQVVQNHRTSGA